MAFSTFGQSPLITLRTLDRLVCKRHLLENFLKKNKRGSLLGTRQ